MSKNFTVKINDGNKTLETVKLNTTNKVVIKVQPNVNYELVDDATQYAPQNIVTKWVMIYILPLREQTLMLIAI